MTDHVETDLEEVDFDLTKLDSIQPLHIPEGVGAEERAAIEGINESLQETKELVTTSLAAAGRKALGLPPTDDQAEECGFAELLAYYINHGGVSARAIARGCGMNRSRVERIASGALIPTTAERTKIQKYCAADAARSMRKARLTTDDTPKSIEEVRSLAGLGGVPFPHIF